MSAGLMSDARLGEAVPCAFPSPVPSKVVVVTVEFSIGTPSTTKSGSPVLPSVLAPRMRIAVEAPGSPEVEVTSTLGALAERALTTLGSLLRLMSDESTLFLTLPSFSTSDTVPAPVTTISPSWSGLAARAKSWTTPPGRIVMPVVCGLNPIALTISVVGWPS
jgi:hypothetical protein